MENNEQNNEELDMSIFGDAPVIDLGEDDGLFLEEEHDVDLEGKPIVEPSDDEENNNLSNEDDNSSETVVGEDNDNGDDTGDDDTDSEEGSSDSSPNLFSSLATLLNEEGLLSSVESIEDKEKFIEAFKKEIENNEYSDLSETQKTYLKALRDGIPEETVKENIKTMTGLESITNEVLEAEDQGSAELRQRIIYNDFLNRGYSEEKALKYLKRSVELKADVEDAKEALESLKEYNQNSLEQERQRIANEKEQAEKARENEVKALKDTIQKSKEIISGFPLTDNVRKQMEENMFNIVGKSPTGEEENSLMKYARENKNDFQLKLNYLFTITKGFQDFNIIEKSKNSAVIKDLEQALRSNTRIKDSGNPAYIQDPDSYIDIAGHDLA